MTDTIKDIDVDHEDYDGTPKALREHVKRLQSAIKEISTERDTFKGHAQSAALSGALTGFKNPERVKKDLLSDGIDPLDNEAVKAWLGSNGDDYAQGGDPATPNSTGSEVDQSEIEEHQRIASVGQFSSAADMTKLDAAKAEITEDMSGAQIIQVYKKHGL